MTRSLAIPHVTDVTVRMPEMKVGLEKCQDKIEREDLGSEVFLEHRCLVTDQSDLSNRERETKDEKLKRFLEHSGGERESDPGG